MIQMFFGVPGTGKTTLLVSNVLRDSKRYKYVYTNVRLTDVPDNVIFIQNDWLGKYDIRDGVIHIDEASIFADSRDYKNTKKSFLDYLMLYRHYHIAKMCYYSQTYNGVDKKVRSLCDGGLFYMYKPFLTGHWFTKYYRIPYGIVIPDAKKNKQLTGNSLGEIEEGYCKPSLLMRLFCKRLYRPKYYKHFDSWEAPALPPLPETDQKKAP